MPERSHTAVARRCGMTAVSELESRIKALEAELVSHRRVAMMIFLEFVARRPLERVHLIALLRDLVEEMGPETAAISRLLIKELSTLPHDSSTAD